jgi:hypothetical protein
MMWPPEGGLTHGRLNADSAHPAGMRRHTAPSAPSANSDIPGYDLAAWGLVAQILGWQPRCQGFVRRSNCTGSAHQNGVCGTASEHLREPVIHVGEKRRSAVLLYHL